jgi:hypothetical protein
LTVSGDGFVPGWDDDEFGEDWEPPVSTVRIGGWNEKGPVAYIESAVCDVCGRWATTLATTRTARCNAGGAGDPDNARISRALQVVVYACSQHYDQVIVALCEEYGQAGNTYHPDELAQAVEKRALAALEPDDD